MESDVQLLAQAARLGVERGHALAFVDTRELVDEFARSIRQELDYRLEGRNADTFHHNFAGHPHVSVPRVYWSYTRPRVLTMEYLEGVQVADLELEAWSLDQRRRLAYLIAEAWVTMIFRHGFFHGDPHPANILVLSPGEIDPMQVIREAFALIYRMNLRLPTRYVLLDKAVATVGSVGVDLYPDFNVFEVARPYARSLMLERFTPERVLRRANRETWQLAHVARELPYQIHAPLEQMREGQVGSGFAHKGLDEFMHKLDVLANRLA